MMNYLKLSLAVLTFIAVKTNAQVVILDTKKSDKIKKGNTHIMVGSINFPGAAKYLEAAKKNWTLSNGIDFLSPDYAGTLTPNDSFLSLEALNERRGSVTNIYYYLTFWTCKEKYFKKERGLKQSDHEPVAQISLSVDPKALFGIHDFFKNNDFDGGGFLYNWSPGMLGNYLQQMTKLLNAGKKVEIQDDITNKEELVKLSKQTLYVPDFNLIGFSPFLIRKKSADEDKIFEDYKYAYKVVKKDDLDKLITESQEPEYYLIFIKDSSSKIVCVINSKSGETIYSRAKSLSYNLKSGDLKELYKEINNK
jgi:hypothetical protein